MFAKRGLKFFYGYVVLATVWLIYFCNVGFLLYGTSAVNARMIETLGFQADAVGTAVSLCTVMQGVAGPLTGWMITRKGIKRPFLIGSLLIVLGSLLIIFFTRSEVLFILSYGLLLGMGMGMAGMITTQSAVNDWFHARKPFAMAVALSAGGIGGFVAPQVVKAMVNLGDWRYGWCFIAAMGLLSAVLTFLFLVGKPADIGQVPDGLPAPGGGPAPKKAPAMPFRQVFRTPAFYLVLFNYITRTALYYSYTGHIVVYLTSRSIGYSDAVLTVSIVSIASLAGRFCTAAIPDRVLRPNQVLGLGNIVMALGMLVVNRVPGLGVLYAAAAFFGVGLGFVHVSLPLTLSRFFGEENFAMVNGTITPVNYIIGAVGPLAVGVVATATGNFAGTFLVLSVLAALGGLAAIAARPCRPAAEAQAELVPHEADL